MFNSQGRAFGVFFPYEFETIFVISFCIVFPPFVYSLSVSILDVSALFMGHANLTSLSWAPIRSFQCHALGFYTLPPLLSPFPPSSYTIKAVKSISINSSLSCSISHIFKIYVYSICMYICNIYTYVKLNT